MKTNIVVMSYGKLSQLLDTMSPTLPPDVGLRVVNAFLDEVVDMAKEIEQRKEVDVFISAGANASLLTQHVTTPVVHIRVSGFDLLLAVKKLDTEEPIGLITYRKPLPYLSDVSHYVRARIHQETYDSVITLDQALDRLGRQGIRHIIGTSLVLQKAAERSLQCALLYSSDGVSRAVESAVQMALSRKRDMERSAQLNTILTYAPCGVMATDSLGYVREYNPAAAHIVGVPQEKVLNVHIGHSFPNNKITAVMASGQAELNHIHQINGTTIVTNRVPVCDDKGQVQGCVVTFQDVDTVRKAEASVRRHSRQNFKARFRLEGIVGQSPLLEEVRQRARHFAESDATVLIQGESGTGKELFAQGVHLAGPRSNRAFVAINCATLPASVLESELFGYEEGAFTDAKRGGKAGLFEIAHKGSIFLDEIAELPLNIQARLLRVLEEREFLRVGGSQIIQVNVRIIAATNKNLQELVQKRLFRDDLFYRLNVLRLDIPPLRHRLQDVPLLVEHMALAHPHITEVNRRELMRHPALTTYVWPGNVRELRNFMEAFAVLCRSGKNVDALVKELLPNNKMESVFAQECSQEELARRLGISRTTLWRRQRKAKNEFLTT